MRSMKDERVPRPRSVGDVWQKYKTERFGLSETWDDWSIHKVSLRGLFWDRFGRSRIRIPFNNTFRQHGPWASQGESVECLPSLDRDQIRRLRFPRSCILFCTTGYNFLCESSLRSHPCNEPVESSLTTLDVHSYRRAYKKIGFNIMKF